MRQSSLLALLLNFLLLAASALVAHAQVAGPEPYHLAHLRGFFVDEKGNPISNAAVTLDQNDKVVYSTQTNSSGRFEMKHVDGRYWLHVHSNGYSTVNREVIVGVEALTYLHSETLYIIAGPGACSDDCSSIFTSKTQFDHAIRKNTAH
jgi:hypothetical protein